MKFQLMSEMCVSPENLVPLCLSVVFTTLLIQRGSVDTYLQSVRKMICFCYSQVIWGLLYSIIFLGKLMTLCIICGKHG